MADVRRAIQAAGPGLWAAPHLSGAAPSNATFLDANDPDYKLFLLWLTNGSKP